MSEHATTGLKPPGIRGASWRFWLWVALLSAGLGIGLISIITVMTQGLGVTNLTDKLPWGLWITVDLSFIALGAGGFTLSAMVYIFGLKRYEAIARAAIWVGLLGYTSAMLALFVDIGRPDRFYHPMLYWNVHSVLWEITICVMLYSTVLIIELVPVVIESTRLSDYPSFVKLGHNLHRLMPVVAFVGLGLSLLHQSSLGATYGILVARPFWYSPSAPVLFILSAIAAGISAVLALTIVSGRLLHRQQVPKDIISSVARFAGFAVLAYLYLKLWSWAATNYYSHTPGQTLGQEILNQYTPYSYTFWLGEVLFGALVPAFLLLWSRTRRNPYAVVLAALMIIAGLVINRWNMTLAGFVIPLDWSPGVLDVFPVNTYFPSLVEWGVALGVVSYAGMVFTLGVRFLTLYPEARPMDVPEVIEDVSESQPAVEPPAPADQTATTTV
ncbi:MAG: NrfD/PsrC family molybdoenzyme membrane anchor subunit [Anaerolineae bacterium]